MSAPAPAKPVSSPTPHLTPNQRRTEKASRVRLKHGFWSDRAVIPGESEDDFAQFREDMILSLLPGSPMENALVDQMVMAQWKLQRMWAAQSGVHLRLNKANPPAGDASYPERVAECIHQDNASTGDLHRMSLEELRLVNIFHKASRKLELLTEQRHKRLMHREQRNQIETEEYYLGREGYLKFGIRPPKLDASGRLNPAWTDPDAPVEVPTEVPMASPAAVAEMVASGSEDGRSPENEDRQPTTPPALRATSPASSGGSPSDQSILAEESDGLNVEESSHCLQGEVPRRGGEGLWKNPTPSNKIPSGKFTEQTPPPPPKAPRPRRRRGPLELDPRHLTPYQQYWEDIQAADDAFGDRLEGKVAAGD